MVAFGCSKDVSVDQFVAEHSVISSPQIVDFTLSTPVPTCTPSPTDTPVPREPKEYSFAWISDTQFYTRQNNGVFECMTDYLNTNRLALNLQYVIFTGDFVHERDQKEQWIIADKSMQTIEQIPNGVLAGNHDVGSDPFEYNYDKFCEVFGENRYNKQPWYGESYKNNRGHYDLLSFGETDYIFVYLGYHLDDEGIMWAKAAFYRYPDRVGVLCVHSYFDTDLSLLDDGIKLKDEIIQPCKNVYMVLCGHRYSSACIPVHLDDNGDGTSDRTVLQMIANYQAIGDKKAPSRTGGDGYIRFLNINELTGILSYYSYSPYLDDYTYFDDPKHRTEKYSFDPESEQGSFEIPWISFYKS